MKICELRIQNYNDREKIVLALVNAGYKISVDIRSETPYGIDAEYILIVESEGEKDD